MSAVVYLTTTTSSWTRGRDNCHTMCACIIFGLLCWRIEVPDDIYSHSWRLFPEKNKKYRKYFFPQTWGVNVDIISDPIGQLQRADVNIYTCRRTRTHRVCGGHIMLDDMYPAQHLRWTPLVGQYVPCTASSVDTTCWTGCTLRSSLIGKLLLEGLYPAQLFPRIVQCKYT